MAGTLPQSGERPVHGMTRTAMSVNCNTTNMVESMTGAAKRKKRPGGVYLIIFWFAFVFPTSCSVVSVGVMMRIRLC
jgi:hypothetical protein